MLNWGTHILDINTTPLTSYYYTSIRHPITKEFFPFGCDDSIHMNGKLSLMPIYAQREGRLAELRYSSMNYHPHH